MDSSAKLLTGILVLVILTLPLAPAWFLVFPVLIGMIALSWDRRRRRSTENQGLPIRNPRLAGDGRPPADDAPPPAVDAPAPAPAGGAPPRAGDAPAPAPAPDPADDAPPPAGDAPAPAPAPAGDAPPRAGDAPAPAPAPDPAGGAPPRAGDAPAPAPAPDPAGDAPPPAGDASAPALAVVAAGIKMRRKPESSSILSSSSRIKYDVFLSFRGSDTRTAITDHLYKRLVGVGISVFRDDEEHPVEEELPTKLNEVIERSRISIPILSRDYASSKWCLSELLQMWKCMELYGRTVIPIFYDVSPSDVRRQAGEFGRAFDLHERNVGSDTIEKWMEALRKIGELRGYSGKLYKGYESQLIEEVAVDVARKLRDDDLVAANKLGGIDFHVQKTMRKLGVAYSKRRAAKVHGEDVRVIGICGVPGIRKTTLAKVVYDEIRHLFDACTFIPDISLKGVQFSRLMLIADLQTRAPAPLESSGEGTKEIASVCRNAKVLIVLDNVDDKEQIQALAGKLTWFGSGSRIIVTTNNREILSAFTVGADDRGTVEDHEGKPMSYSPDPDLFPEDPFFRDPEIPFFGDPTIPFCGDPTIPFFGDPFFGDDPLFIEIVTAIGGLPSVIVDHASS